MHHWFRVGHGTTHHDPPPRRGMQTTSAQRRYRASEDFADSLRANGPRTKNWCIRGRNRSAMNETSNVVPLRQPDEIDDPLTKAASHEAYTSTTCIIPSSS